MWLFVPMPEKELIKFKTVLSKTSSKLFLNILFIISLEIFFSIDE